MTIIVYRDGVMAADSLVISHHNLRVGMLRKLGRRASDGAVAGAAGYGGDVTDFLRWFVAAEVADWRGGKDAEAGFAALIARPDGRVFGCDVTGWLYGIDAPFHARGSAAPVAIGALAMGATAEEAVKVCIEFDIHCGGPLQLERVGPDAPRHPGDKSARLAPHQAR